MAGADGTRRIAFYLPFEAPTDGRRLEEIVFQPATMETMLRWSMGQIIGPFGSIVALMADLSGWETTDILAIRYPDAERVSAEFMAHLPEAIAGPIREGQYPAPQQPQEPIFDSDEGWDRPEPQARPRPSAVDPGDDLMGRVRPSSDPTQLHDHSGIEFPPTPSFDPLPGEDGAASGPGLDLSDG